MSGKIAELREKARRCRELARRMDPETRARLNSLADAYTKEAEALEAEESGTGSSST